MSDVDDSKTEIDNSARRNLDKYEREPNENDLKNPKWYIHPQKDKLLQNNY